MSSWAERTWKVAAGGLGWARQWLADPVRQGIVECGGQGCSWWTWWQTAQPRVPAWGKKASNHRLKAPMGVEASAGETPSLTGESIGETHRVLEHTQTHPPGKQHQKGPNWLWVEGGVTANRQRVEQAPLLPLGPTPTYGSQHSDQRYPTYRSGWMCLLYLFGCWTSIQFDFLAVLVVLFFKLLFFFWLCEEAQCVYLRLHLGGKSQVRF